MTPNFAFDSRWSIEASRCLFMLISCQIILWMQELLLTGLRKNQCSWLQGLLIKRLPRVRTRCVEFIKRFFDRTVWKLNTAPMNLFRTQKVIDVFWAWKLRMLEPFSVCLWGWSRFKSSSDPSKKTASNVQAILMKLTAPNRLKIYWNRPLEIVKQSKDVDRFKF